MGAIATLEGASGSGDLPDVFRIAKSQSETDGQEVEVVPSTCFDYQHGNFGVLG